MKAVWTRGAIAALLVVALVLPLAPASGAPSNARPQALSVANPIQDMAFATQAGSVLVGTSDPGSRLMTPDATTWWLWDAQGNPVHSGSADVESCGQQLTATDPCTSRVAAVAISANGKVFAVASDVAAPLVPATTPTRALVLMGSEDSGAYRRIPQTQPILDMDFDATGETLAILHCVPAGSGACSSDARLVVHTWNGDTLTKVVEHPIPGGVGVDVSPDGQRIVAWGTHHFRVHRNTNALHTASTVAGTATAAAADSGSASHWSVAGYASGEVALFADASPATSIFSRKPSTDDVRAVAIRPGGAMYVAGDEAGSLHQFEIKALTGGANPTYKAAFLRSEDTGAGPVRDLEFSADGTLLVAATAGEVRTYQVNGTKLQHLWTHAPAGAPVRLGVMHDGAVTAAQHETGVAFYDALHRLAVPPMEPLVIVPKGARDATVTLSNTGNRDEAVDLGLQFPAGWFVTAAPKAFDLKVGASRDVKVHVVVPEDQEPGTSSIWLNNSAAKPGKLAVRVAVEVPGVQLIGLVDKPPSSKAIMAGATAEFTAILSNDGNVAAAPALVSSIEPEGWGLELGRVPASLAPGEQKEVSVTILAPDTAGDGDRGVARLNLGGDPQTEVRFTATVGAAFGVEIKREAPAFAVPLGNDTRFEIQVENTGNVPDTFDVRLSAPAPAGWLVAFPSNGQPAVGIGELEPGELGAAEVLVRVPADAAIDTTVILTIQAISQGDPTRTDTKQIQLTVVAAGTTPGFQGGGKDSPAPPLALILAGLAAAAFALRRRPS